ncbi:MAG: hypothetical protein AAFQ10_12445 [Pseudomonadota bacterium]
MATLSNNQLVTTLCKACIGVGVARGIAEDISQALAKLGDNELNKAIEELNLALKAYDPNDKDLAKPQMIDRGYMFPEARLLHHGPSIVEWANAVGDGNEVILVSIFDCPCCLEALVKFAEQPGQLLRTKAGLELDFSIDRLEYMPPGGFYVSRVELMQAEWDEILEYSRNTMVPSDASSQADAGAGDSDND